jgi:Putative MetA-pathway of phenol degradation
MRYTTFSLLVLSSQICFGAELTQSTAPADGRFSVSIGADYSSGDYGAAENTDVWAIPISLKYRTGLWRFGLSTSWLRVTSPNNVNADGEFVGSGGAKTTETGMGDVYLSTSYNLLDDSDHMLGLDVIGKVKIPTANENKFLGTGKTDYSLNFEVFKTIHNWTPYWNVGYKWKGDPSGIDYNNVWSSTLGFDYQMNHKLTLGASYDWQQKVSQFSQNVHEISIYSSYRLNEKNKLNFYLLTGFNDASPNWGSGLVLVHYF